jgi:hypothetical protein
MCCHRGFFLVAVLSIVACASPPPVPTADSAVETRPPEVPEVTEVTDVAHHLRAAAEVHKVGNAMFSWLSDHPVDAVPPELIRTGGSFGVTQYDGTVATYEVVAAPELARILVPSYLAALPTEDPWGYPYEYAVNPNLQGANVLAIRSRGGDGVFQDGPYARGQFEPTNWVEDVVWADGSWVRYIGAALLPQR